LLTAAGPTGVTVVECEMHRRTWSLALAGLLLLGALSACSGDKESSSGQQDSSSNSSDELPSAKSTPNPDRTSSGDGSSGEPGGGTDSSGTGSSGDSGPADNGLIPDNIGSCFDEAAAFGKAIGLAVTDSKSAEEALAQIQAKLPESLADDLAVVQNALRVGRDNGLTEGAQAMDTQEFRDAAGAIGSYFANQCGSSGQ